MPSNILPSGPLNVRATDSQAPCADTLLGRPHIPAIASAVHRIGATVKGFVEQPLAPLQGRDEILAQWERGIDIEVDGGVRLRALDAASGKFHVHLTPSNIDHRSLHVAFAPEGDEKNAVVQDHPHAPSAPVGFYNLERSQQALDTVERVLQAAVDAPETSNVNRLRAESILGRLNKTQAYLSALAQVRQEHPILGTLKQVAEYAYETKKFGDENDEKFKSSVGAIESYVKLKKGSISNEVAEQVQEEVANLKTDQKKWVDWRARTGIQTYYVNFG
ncbi:MAG: hypothetical protein VYC39_16900 [Myxococcota bacterium]|nr:hypothetical protein [Myxococcota bacterium]